MFFFLPPFQHLTKVECTQSDQSSAVRRPSRKQWTFKVSKYRSMKLLCCISWLLKSKETHDGNSAYGNSIMNTLVMDIMDWIREKEIVHWNNIQSDLFSFYQLNECNEGASISKNSIVCNFIQVKYAVVVFFFVKWLLIALHFSTILHSKVQFYSYSLACNAFEQCSS